MCLYYYLFSTSRLLVSQHFISLYWH